MLPLLLLLLLLDASVSANDEKCQAMMTVGNFTWSELKGDFLQEEVDESTDKCTTIFGVVLL
jgi:hypothetical protein